MSKKLFLGLILCVGLQALKAADQGDHPAQTEPTQPAQEWALVTQKHQVAAFDRHTANAGQVAQAAGALALRAGAALAEQSVPALRDGIGLGLKEIAGAGDALIARYQRDGIFPSIGAAATGGLTGLVAAVLAREFLPTPIALGLGTMAGTRTTRVTAQYWNRIFGTGFTMTIKNSDNIDVYASDNTNFNRSIITETLYNENHPEQKHYTVHYEVRAPFGTIRRETRSCTTLTALNVILDEIKETLQAAQQ